MSGTHEMSSYMKAIVAKAVDTASKIAGEAYREAVHEVIPQIEAEYNDIYKRSTAAWYSAYTPRKYHRHYSIYNLFHLEADQDAMRLDYEMSEDGMTRGANGFSLWDRVFVRGYHGGPRPGFNVRSTPVHKMFNTGKEEAEQKYREMINRLTAEKYYKMMGK